MLSGENRGTSVTQCAGLDQGPGVTQQYPFAAFSSSSFDLVRFLFVVLFATSPHARDESRGSLDRGRAGRAARSSRDVRTKSRFVRRTAGGAGGRRPGIDDPRSIEPREYR